VTSSRWRREVLALAAAYGATVSKVGSGHLVIRHPSGWFCYAPATPSEEKRSLHNTRRDVRRAARGLPHHR